MDKIEKQKVSYEIMTKEIELLNKLKNNLFKTT